MDIGNGICRYFQFIALDLHQLNSEVIRVFEQEYKIDDDINLQEIVHEKVQFYAHTVLFLGVERDLIWTHVGNSLILGDMNFYFRAANADNLMDMKNDELEEWWVWKIGEDSHFIGKLNSEQKKYELGMIFHPDDILERIKYGEFFPQWTKDGRRELPDEN